MAAIMWKELRENIKWAVLWMVGMGLAMLFVLFQPAYWYGAASICRSEFLTVTTVGCAVGALLLGAIQVMFELQRDQWAFLVHRPVSRNTIFAGKCLAGLGLYFAATGIPFGIAVWWASTPGNVAGPFDWRMVLPGIADMLTGVVFYFAGMLTGMRRARWHGSRLCGVAMAVAGAFAVNFVWQFWHALLVILLAGAVLGLAAWGGFITGGTVRTQPRIARVALGSSLTMGLTVAIWLAGYMVLLMFMVRSNEPYVIHEVDKQGDVLRITTDYDLVHALTDLDGTPMERYADERFQHYGVLRREILPSTQVRAGCGWLQKRYRDVTRYIFGLTYVTDMMWYYVPATHRFEVYSAKTKRRVAVLHPQVKNVRLGAAELGPIIGFDSKLGTLLCCFAEGVYELSPRTRLLRRVMSASPEDPVAGCEYVSASESDHGASWSGIAVATRQRLHILNDDSTPVMQFDLEYGYEKYPAVTLMVMPGRQQWFIRFYPSGRLSAEDRAQVGEHLIAYDATGTLVQQWDLPMDLRRSPVPPWLTLSTAVVHPPGLAAVFGGYAYWGPGPGAVGRYHITEELASVGVNPKSYFAIMLVSVAVAAMIALLVSRRYAFSRNARIGWLLVVLILGPLGLLVMLALLEWPALETCHGCGRKRVVTRDQCPRCGLGFPEPIRDGTEIFDDEIASAAG